MGLVNFFDIEFRAEKRPLNLLASEFLPTENNKREDDNIKDKQKEVHKPMKCPDDKLNHVQHSINVHDILKEEDDKEEDDKEDENNTNNTIN